MLPAVTDHQEPATQIRSFDRVAERFELKPKHVAGDVAYGTGEMLGWLVARGIDPHIPVRDKGQRDDGTFSRRPK